MGAGDIPSGEHQVLDIPGVQAPEGDAVRLAQAALLQMRAPLGLHEEAAGQVVIDLPAAVGHGVREYGMALHVLLLEDVVAHITAALPLAGQEAHPFQLPVLGPMVAPVLDVVPGAEGDLQQFVPNCFGIGNAVLLTAQLYPVEVGIDGVDVMRLVVHLLIGLEGVSPGGRGELHGMVGLPGLDEQAHAHGLAVCLRKAELLAELGLGLPAHPELGPGQGRENAVAGAVHEDIGLDGMPGVGGQLEAGDGDDLAAVHFRIAAGAVQQQLDVRLKSDHFIKKAVPDGEIPLGIAVHIFQQQLLQDAGLLQIADPGACTGDPHANLGAGVAAQHRTVVHQHDFGTVAGCGDGREHTADAAADNAELRLVFDRVEFHSFTPHFSDDA